MLSSGEHKLKSGISCRFSFRILPCITCTGSPAFSYRRRTSKTIDALANLGLARAYAPPVTLSRLTPSTKISSGGYNTRSASRRYRLPTPSANRKMRKHWPVKSRPTPKVPMSCYSSPGSKFIKLFVDIVIKAWYRETCRELVFYFNRHW